MISCWHYMPLIWCNENDTLCLCFSLPKTRDMNLIMEKVSNDSQLRDIQQDNWPLFLKTGKWSRSAVSDSLWTPWTVAHQAPPSMGFSRQEYLSGLPFPSPGDLLDPGIKPTSPTLWAEHLTSEPPGQTQLKLVRSSKTWEIWEIVIVKKYLKRQGD